MVGILTMPTSRPLARIYLIRHGETAWSLSGQHTSRTDLPLTPRGEEEAQQLRPRLAEIKFTRVLTSPRLRARQTCELTGLGTAAEVENDLREWDYGDYEGKTRAEVCAERDDWNLFIDGAPGGESPAEVFSRATEVVRRLQLLEGNVAVFSHGHFLRVLATTWAEFPVVQAQRLGLSTASLGILSHEHDDPARPIISLWNETQPSLSSR